MCDPLTAAIAVGAAAAGTGLQTAGNRQADKAEAGVLRAETARQRALADNSRAQTAAATQQASRPSMETAAANAEAVRTSELRAAGGAATADGSYLPGMDGAPQIVRDEVDRQRRVADLFMDQQAAARARLGGWGDALFGTQINTARAGQGIATNASFARGSAGVVPLEQRAAAQRGAGLRMAGDAVTAAGMLAAPHARGGLASLFGGAPAAGPGVVSRVTAPGMHFP